MSVREPVSPEQRWALLVVGIRKQESLTETGFYVRIWKDVEKDIAMRKEEIQSQRSTE